MKDRNCERCHNPLASHKRKDARFCSKRCGQASYHDRNKELHNASTARWREKNQERYLEGVKRYYRANRKAILAKQRLRSYGLTDDEYRSLMERQGGSCAICGTDKPRGRHNSLHIDHDHKTGLVRGLLCDSCNLGLGKFKDDPKLLINAAWYLSNQQIDGLRFVYEAAELLKGSNLIAPPRG